jgi:hypothetical protein
MQGDQVHVLAAGECRYAAIERSEAPPVSTSDRDQVSVRDLSIGRHPLWGKVGANHEWNVVGKEVMSWDVTHPVKQGHRLGWSHGR